MNSRRGAHKPLSPFSADHFREYARQLVLDSGAQWEPEDFQLEAVADIFSDVPEVWLVVPEGCGKTTLMGGVALYHADYTDDAAVLLGASSRDQCGILLGQAAGFIARSPGLDKRFRFLKGYRRIEALRSGGEIQVHAADERTGDGVLPTLALLDELHRHKDLGLYRTWRGKLGKRGGTLVAISTAGEPDSEFEEVRKRARVDADDVVVVGRHSRAASAEMVLHEHALLPGDDPNDLELVKQANPFSGITVETLRRKRASPSMIDSHWLRFVCNVASAGDDAWLPDGAWDACRSDLDIPPFADVFVGVDIGLKKDSTAVVVCAQVEDRVVVRSRVFNPPGQGQALDLADVEAHIRDLADTYSVRKVSYDRWSFERSAQMLSDEGLVMDAFPMSNERTAPASSRLYEGIVTGKVAHDGDPVLTAHVNAGETRETERGWRISKGKGRRKVDALIALMIAFSFADQPDVVMSVEHW